MSEGDKPLVCAMKSHSVSEDDKPLVLFQCHHLVTEEASQEMTEMFAEETLNQATGGPVSTRHLRQQAELNYQRRAEQAMADDNCFKFVFVRSSFFFFLLF